MEVDLQKDNINKGCMNTKIIEFIDISCKLTQESYGYHHSHLSKIQRQSFQSMQQYWEIQTAATNLVVNLVIPKAGCWLRKMVGMKV